MSCIKSVQRGTGSGNATITISAVDMSKSVVLIFGGSGYQGSDYGATINNTAIPFAYLDSDTTLKVLGAISHGNSGNDWYDISVSYAWQVIEFC